eukprot:CAMPEP_0173301838 /NCGR_PEP_ID=MMETSP1143-20121109/18014_1 /TAXON_ID=483371 /ORGANISM="non described non described, Strain CCMP2298" /LENGTH=235 /DNA_ID=CAMNT_0014242397 /DNA_START=164 /DNA_END=868 /DNA_ORIENTATION=-
MTAAIGTHELNSNPGTADGYADGLLLGCELGTDEGCRYRDREHQDYLARVQEQRARYEEARRAAWANPHRSLGQPASARTSSRSLMSRNRSSRHTSSEREVLCCHGCPLGVDEETSLQKCRGTGCSKYLSNSCYLKGHRCGVGDCRCLDGCAICRQEQQAPTSTSTHPQQEQQAPTSTSTHPQQEQQAPTSTSTHPQQEQQAPTSTSTHPQQEQQAPTPTSTHPQQEQQAPTSTS